MRNIKKTAIVLLCTVLALSLSLPMLSFANTDEQASSENQAIASSTSQADSEDASTASEKPLATNCTATVKYYEIVTYEEPGVPPDSENRYLLGTRTIENLTEGDVLNAWDYVVDIKGFFFFDGWPLNLTVSADSEQNEIVLFYGRYWNHSYTVNYYLMAGANLTADTWNGALQPEGVEFEKFATETFENQPYGALIGASQYEAAIDETYFVDAYPAQIRVGIDPYNESINLLYVPAAANLPDSFEIVETPQQPQLPGNNNGNTGESTNPGIGPGPDSGTGNGSNDSLIQAPQIPSLPSIDQSGDSNGTMAPLPDTLTREEAINLFEQYINEETQNEAVIVDDDSPTIDPETARQIIAAYDTGIEHGKAQSTATVIDHLICILIMIILVIIAIVFLVLYLRERKRTRELSEALASASDPTLLE